MFSLEQRLEFARVAVKDYLNVTVDVCDGFVYEYCKSKGIEKVYRGYRNKEDLKYEEDMAKFNAEHGLRTQLVEGIREISSSLIREKLKNGEDIKKYLPDGVAKEVVKAYKEKL